MRRPDMVLLPTAEAAKLQSLQLVDDFSGGQGIKMFYRDMQRRTPRYQRARNANQMAMGINQYVEAGW
ncbi:hypothetical protein [Altererythrobacter sp. B11]|uniref:hypothetical protein n=1 Tax=Altererythrobacter sp. B11 TaxID=2060312 RepID=UPI0011AE3BEF|nr:hypothetical protein [Altererythrobacter sp. B11]